MSERYQHVATAYEPWKIPTKRESKGGHALKRANGWGNVPRGAGNAVMIVRDRKGRVLRVEHTPEFPKSLSDYLNADK